MKGFPSRKRRGGFALLLVLIIVTFAAAIAVLFLVSARQERTSTDTYAQGSRVRQLSSEAVNIVIGQINAATREGTSANPVAWASQPGMIRTYNQSGTLSNAYKLYSWANMTEGKASTLGVNFDPTSASEYPTSDWSTKTALFTDLNQPVNSVYPIMDPNVADLLPASGNATSNNKAGIAWDFPGEVGIPAASATNNYYPTASNTLPMPVQWLYVLRDGTWVVPTAGGSPTSVNVAGATNANPIVGRIAFWTDDETAKVNVNTASEGAYWDVPKSASPDDMQFAGNPPVKNEFYRISGHPATTSLSAVFPEMRANAFSRWATGGAANATYLTELPSILGMNPRISWGAGNVNGSQGGTWPASAYNYTYASAASNFVNPNTYGPVALNSNRLYTTADDFWFQPTRSPNALANYSGTGGALTPQSLSQRLFFLTANSSAPETTLFETPRISLWPITYPNKSSYTYSFSSNWSGIGGLNPFTGRSAKLAASSYSLTPNTTPNPPQALAGITTQETPSGSVITPQEQLLAFCSTLNEGATAPSLYYFQRQNPDSPTYDWSNITRNQTLVNYADKLMNAQTPGIGKSLASKWGANNTDWIALNCFDFSRSFINQYTFDPNATTNDSLLYSYTGIFSRDTVMGTGAPIPVWNEPNVSTVVPLRAKLHNNTYVTEGSFPALKEAAIMFYATARNAPVPPAGANGQYVYSSSISGEPATAPTANYDNPDNWTNLISKSCSRTTSMQAVMLFSFAGMNPGNQSFAPVFWIKVSPAGTNFTAGGVSFTLQGSVQWNTICNWGCSRNFAPLFYKQADQPKMFQSESGAQLPQYYPLVSGQIPTMPNQTTFAFTGGQVEVDIYAAYPTNLDTDPTGDSNQLVSSQTIDFGQWGTARAPGQLAIPLAPRWTTLQTLPPKTQTLPLLAHQVPMPDPVNPVTHVASGTNAGSGANSDIDWQTEIVPIINNLSSVGNAPMSVDNRNAATPSYPTGYPVTSNPSSSYVYAGSPGSSPGDLHVSYSPAIGAGGLISTDLRCRVIGLACRVPSWSFASEDGTSSTNLFNGYSTSLPGNQAVTLITPYDTVISMVADPNSAIGGDQRLMGRGIHNSGQTGNTTFVALNQVAGMTTINPPTNGPNHVIHTTGNDTMTVSASGAISIYPLRTTDQSQWHELGCPAATDSTGGYASLPTMTGIQPVPSFGGYSTGSHSFTYTSTGTLNTSSSDATFMATTGSGIEDGAPWALGWSGSGPGLYVPDTAIGLEANATMSISPYNDWTSMPGNDYDGALIARPDQDYQCMLVDYSANSYMTIPYFGLYGTASVSNGSNSSATTGAFFMPNRQVPSPVILGTLPSDMNTGWQTFSFCPNPAKTMNGGGVHPGPGVLNTPSASGAPYSSVPDHLLLDLFWMPVAEPYPISEQFATAGKVNLNYAIMPFSYIQRKTALDAVLKAVWIDAMPSSISQYYKSAWQMANYKAGVHTRYPINVQETLKAFDAKFAAGDVFRAASQICDMFLYPNDPATANTPLKTYDSANANITGWWAANGDMTSMNGRQEPYNAIYSRITTKSNTYTVHWRVQALHKITVNGSVATVWTDGVDQVTAELRGSTLIERYLDPNANDIPDYAADTSNSATPLSYFYKWRVANESYFQPPP